MEPKQEGMVEICRLNQDKKLLSLIAHGLQSYSESQTISQLGDRRQYVGMSDIALMSECTRLAVLRKRSPLNSRTVTLQNYEEILKKQLTLQRGHWLEEGISNALYANAFHLIPQLEIEVQLPDNITLKIHLDFVLVGENVIRILELKSNEKLPSQAQKSHELQVRGQVSFLYKYWNEAVFNLKDAQGVILYQKKTFPEICKEYLGIIVKNKEKIDLQGWLLCVSMTKAKAFGPYIAKRTLVYEQFAKALWKSIENNDEIQYAKGFCKLCSFCEYSDSCPKFVGDSLPEWEQIFDEIEKLKDLKDSATEQISVLEQNIKLSLFSTELKGKWLTAGKYRFKVGEQQGRRTLNRNLLTAELTSFMDENSIEQLLANAETESAPSARLYTNIITS